MKWHDFVGTTPEEQASAVEHMTPTDIYNLIDSIVRICDRCTPKAAALHFLHTNAKTSDVYDKYLKD